MSLAALLGGLGTAVNSYEAQLQARQKQQLNQLEIARLNLENQHYQQQAQIDMFNAKIDGAQTWAKQQDPNAPDPAMAPYQVQPMGQGAGGGASAGGMGGAPGPLPFAQPNPGMGGGGQGGGNELLGPIPPGALRGAGPLGIGAPQGGGAPMGMAGPGNAPQPGAGGPPPPPQREQVMGQLVTQAVQAGLDPKDPMVRMALTQRMPKAMEAAVEQWKNQNEVYKQQQQEKDAQQRIRDQEQNHHDNHEIALANLAVRDATLAASEKSKGWDVFQAKDGTLVRVNKDTGEVKKVDDPEAKNLSKVGGSGGQPRSPQAMALKKYMEENPNATSADISKAAARFAATTSSMKSLYGGKLQQRIDSFNTVADHLDTLEQLVKAFDGGDETTLANIKSAYQREFGKPAPSNKDTAAALVSSEVLKAIEGSSGGVTDREEAKKYLGQNNTAGALGAIGVARKLVGGQLNATRKRVVDADKLISGDEFEDQLTSAARKALEQAGPEPDAPASGGYTIGQKQGGYTYIGGDPTDQKSWQKDN